MDTLLFLQIDKFSPRCLEFRVSGIVCISVSRPITSRWTGSLKYELQNQHLCLPPTLAKVRIRTLKGCAANRVRNIARADKTNERKIFKILVQSVFFNTIHSFRIRSNSESSVLQISQRNFSRSSGLLLQSTILCLWWPKLKIMQFRRRQKEKISGSCLIVKWAVHFSYAGLK